MTFLVGVLLFLLPSSLWAVQTSTVTGTTLQYDNLTGDVHIDGNAVVQTSTATLKADKITFHSKTNDGLAEGNAIVFNSTATLQADKIYMNLNNKAGHADGHVRIDQGSGTITGSSADYNWNTSTGVIQGASGVSPPWRFSSDTMVQDAPGRFRLFDGGITSCGFDPPHYYIRSSKIKLLQGQRATMSNARFTAGRTPVFWLPVYSRSLKPKKYSLRIEPGQSGRDGLIVKSVLGYPFSPNTHTDFRWDYFQRTGNGFGVRHNYNAPKLHGVLDTYSVYDANPDPAPESRRYTLNWNHYQKITSQLSTNARVDFKSDQTFNNQFAGVGNRERIENQVRGLLSDIGFTYQFSKATLEAEFNRKDRFDSKVSSKTFISKLTLPRLNFNTIPLKSKWIPFYTDFSGTFVNETLEATSAKQTLRYQRSASIDTNMSRDIRFKKFTLTPQWGFSERWQDRDLEIPDSEYDLYAGRYNGGATLRVRVHPKSDATFTYNHAARLQSNRLNLDTAASDRGVERNQLNGSLLTRTGASSSLKFSSGYDLRRAPRDNPSKYRHQSVRITAPSMDLQWRVSPLVNIFYRETYAITPIRTPVNTSGEIQLGNASGSPYFSHGFSYSKKSPGQKSTLHMSNKLKIYVTKNWYMDLLIRYRAVGDHQLDYRKIFPSEKSVTVVRNMHCWVFRMQFSQRPDRSEASFYIDLKTNLTSGENIFGQADTGYRPAESDMDIKRLFPE